MCIMNHHSFQVSLLSILTVWSGISILSTVITNMNSDTEKKKKLIEQDSFYSMAQTPNRNSLKTSCWHQYSSLHDSKTLSSSGKGELTLKPMHRILCY